MRSHGYIEEFGKDSVVFLTSDSPHILTGELISLSLPLPLLSFPSRAPHHSVSKFLYMYFLSLLVLLSLFLCILV